jgi:hypothetical protein
MKPGSVFLSYASQDAIAVKKLRDALEAAGIEVGFDQRRLEGGDDFDKEIKRNIRACSFFIPVISAHTQARHEGYFRLEWNLAVERAKLIAETIPFILPVAIDNVSDQEALVPERFLQVQWTRLLLDRHRPKPSEVDLRGWEWRYLWQFCRSDAQAILKEPDDNSIISLAASNDGKWLAAGTNFGGQLSILNLQTQEKISVPAGSGKLPPGAKSAGSRDTGVGSANSRFHRMESAFFRPAQIKPFASGIWARARRCARFAGTRLKFGESWSCRTKGPSSAGARTVPFSAGTCMPSGKVRPPG